jgi:TM2 domain-containing membrane protein YozV
MSNGLPNIPPYGGEYVRLSDIKKKAQFSFNKGNYDDALALYNEVLEISPADDEALNGKGLTLLKLGRETEARQMHAIIQQIRQSPGTGSGPGPSRSRYTTPPAASSYTSTKYHHHEEKNPLVAALCSVLIPGLGQVYNGELGKGVVICALSLVGIIFLLVPGLMVWMYGAFTAYTVAGKINSGKYPYQPTSIMEMLIFAILAIIMIFIAIVVGVYLLSVLLSGMAETWFPNPFEASGIPK